MEPYYAVIFSSEKKEENDGYDQMSEKLFELVKSQPGYLGVDTYSNQEGNSVTISYWKNLDSIKAWKNVPVHAQAQSLGKENWYSKYRIRICKVESDHSFLSE